MIMHKNRDGREVQVGTGGDVSIGADVEIASDVFLGAGSVVGSWVDLGAGTTLRGDSVIGYQVEIGACANLSGALVRRGQYFHLQCSYYIVDAYKRKDGVVMFRHGCETRPLRDWTAALQRRLCLENDRRKTVAKELAKAVRMAREWFRK